MSTWLQKATGKKEEEQTTGTSGWLAAQQKRAKEKAAANAARAAAPVPTKSETPAAPQPSTERSTPAQTGRLRPGWDVSDAATAYQQAIRDTDSSLHAASGLSEIARTRQSPSAAAQTATDLESRMEQYSATMDNTQRNMGAMTPALQQARAGVDQRQREFDGYAQKLTMLQDTFSNEKLDARQRNDAIREYNALLPYARQAAARLDNEVNTYNSLAGQAQQMEAQYNEALLNYQQTLPEYDRISSRGNLDAKAFRSEGDKWSQRAKDLEAEANGTEALHPDFTRMTPEQVGEWQQNYFDLRTQAQEANAKASEYRRQEEAAQRRYQNYQYNQLLAGVEKYQTDPNWDKLSRVDRSMLDGKVQYRNGTVDYGKKDIDYAIINGDDELLSAWNGNNSIAMSKSYLTQMTDRERAAYNYLYAAKGKDAANDFLEKLTPELNERQRGANRKMWTEMAQQDPWGTSAFSVLATPAKMISLFGQAIDLVTDGSIDQNAAYNSYSHIPSDIRGAVSEQIEKKWGKAGSFAYQTGMSMADFLFQSAITGEFFGASAGATGLTKFAKPALLIMGSGAAADTVIELRDRGVDSTRAMALGTVAGLAEIITENVSLENLLNPDMLADGVIRYILKNMAAEGSEELGSDVINWAADALYDLISGQDEAEWKYQIRQLQKEGMGVREATQKVTLDMIKQAGLDALGGALSGGIMAGAGVPIQRALNSNVGQAAGDYIRGVREDIASARQMTNTVYDTPLAQQVVEAPVQIEAPAETRSPLQTVVDKLNAGEQLTGQDARDIIADPQAMQTLQDAGLIDKVIPGRDGRIQVLQAVEQYAQQMQAETAAAQQAGEQRSTLTVPENLAQETQDEQQADITPTEETPRTEGLRLKTAQETLTPAPERVNLLANNRTEVTNNGQTEAPAPAQAEQRTGAEIGQQSIGGDQRRAPDLGTRGGRFIQNFREARAQRQQRNRAASIRYNVAAAGEQALSTNDVGFENGTDTKTFAMLPERLATRDMRKARDMLAKEGVNVHYIQGFLQLQNAAGEIETARGIISPDGKDIWVRADNTILSWQQLLDHELMHRKFQQDPGLRDRILDQLRSDPEVAPYFEEVARQYVQWYNEYNVTDEDEILTELLCDYAGGFNDVQATDTAQRGTKYDVSGIKQVQSIIQTEAQTKSIADALDSGNYEASVQHSYESMANAAGFQAVEKDGERYYVRNGERVTQVTEDDIRNSPIGALISFAADEGYLGNTPEENKAAADAQVKFFSDLCTLATSNNDFGMSMNMAGAVAFTAIKSNADHQYGTTVDFKSICVKTQAIIDAMSAAMVEKQGALTKPEILAIYRRTALNGLPVPCPECYVFSRWIGIGGLLDNIWKYQNHYAGMTERQVSEARENIVNTINDKMAELNANLPADKQLTFGKARGKLKDSITKQYNKLREKIDLADNTGAAVSATDREKLAGLESMMTDVKALSWIDDVYFGGNPAVGKKNPRFEVPADILFDLNKGGEFATQYPEAWGFRTTQGAGYGKAITPYADARIGEAILGAANITGTTKGRLQGNLKNPFSNLQGTVDDDARKKLRQAVAKQKAQLFRGGQRFSSTSDVSNDIASDLLIAMLDMQSMHAGVQMYTKVDGAVGGLSGMGAFVNQSLMPLGSGIKNGELADTAVGGMDPKVAFSNRNRYETAGTITIGVNDRHIRMLFNAINRDFVIPYHASGGDQNLIGEMRSINDPDEAKTAKIRSSDYTKTQNDKVMSDLLLRELGKTDEEIETIHRTRAARLAILTNTKAKPDMSVVRANPILSELYDRFNGGIWDGVKLTKDDVESFIYPNEFWDGTVDYDNSSRNTQLYLDYCDALGFLHRFSGVTPQSVRLPGGGITTRLQPVKGYDENGNPVMLTDLAYIYDEDGNKTDEIEPFFWKSLVDRRMYDNDGKYLPPRTIRLTGVTTEDVTEFAKHNVGRQYSPAASADLANQVRDIVNKNKGNTEAMVSALREILDKQSTAAKPSLSRESEAGQEEVGSTLKTAKGSPIKRNGKYGVGKEIGGKIYLHKQYASEVIPEGKYELAQQIVAEEYPDFTYNCVEYEPKTGIIRFDEAPRFDLDREPEVGDYVVVNPDGSTRKGHTNYIWHHKWLWVKNDYQGFDVEKSWNWSKKWLSTINGKTYTVNGTQYNDNGKSDGNGIERWNTQLEAYGLEKDPALNSGADNSGGIRYSREANLDYEPTTDWQKSKTETWLRENGYDLYGKTNEKVEYDEQGHEIEQQNPTQNPLATLASYQKYYNLIKHDHPADWNDLKVLDASSGYGLGTQEGRDQGFNVTDVEPFPAVSRDKNGKIVPRIVRDKKTGELRPAYKTKKGVPDYSGVTAYTDMIDKGLKFDVILSNCVLNVVPQDQRNDIVYGLKELLAPGGEMYINVRSDKDIGGQKWTNDAKHVQLDNAGLEWFLNDTKAYQKGFTRDELRNYISDLLGPGYAVDIVTKGAPGDKAFGSSAAVVHVQDLGQANLQENGNFSREFMPENLVPYTGQQRTSNRGTRGPKEKVSRVRTHAYELGGLYNEVEAQMAETQPEEFTYDPISEKRSMNEALGRLRKDFDGEAEKLASSDQWGGSDLDTAMGILYQYRQIGRETGDYSLFNEWSHVIQQKGTKGGQFVQAFAKYSRTATGVAQKAAENLRETAGKLNPKQQKLIEGHVSDILGAIDNDTEAAARDAVEKSKGKKGLRLPGGNDTQRARDAENVIKQIHKIFSQQTRRSHGLPVEEWTKATGDQLAGRIASRLKEPGTKTQTTMQTILGDLVTFAQEHALPTQEARQHRTALDRITDYLNNREAYAEAWGEAKQVLRDMYADDAEKLDALESFLNATITYNGDDFDRTMYRAILEASDLLGMDKQDILDLAAVGTTESVINRIADEFVRRVGVDDATLRDTVRRHIENIVREGNVDGRLERMESEASKELDIKIQDLLRESRRTKADAANRIAQYLINDLGISGTDAAIAADHIAGHYMDQLQQRADRVVERMFAEKKAITKKQRDKLLDLIHLGGLTNANVEDAVVDALGLNKVSREKQRQIMDAMAQFADTLDAIEDNDLEGLRQLIREQAAVRNTKLDRLAEKVLSGETDAEYLRGLAMAQLDLIAADYRARSRGEKISTVQVISHLLNARTAMRNLGSNQIFDLVDSLANNAGLLPDMIMSKITGQRSVGLNKSWASQQKRQGAIKGAGRNLLEIALDAAPNDRNQSKYGTGGRRTFSMANSGTVGKILSKLEQVLGYELNTTDEFHKGSVFGETIESLARWVDAGYMTMEEAEEFATEMMLYRSFQDSTIVGSILGGLKDVMNIVGTGKTNGKTIKGMPVHDWGLGDLVVKYTQVPGALVHRAIEYSPVGYLKAIYHMAQLANAKTKGEGTIKQQRKAALALGRATTGTGLITLFALMAKAGLLRRGDDEKDKNAAALKTSQGLSGTQLNLTAIERLFAGESTDPQKGDVLADIGFLEPLDSLMTIAALINNDPELKGHDLYEFFHDPKTASKTLEKSLEGIWLALENTSAMQTLSNIYSTVRYHDEENDLPLYLQIPLEIASSNISGFIPAPVRQIAQATDTTYRDQYRSHNFFSQTGAKVANAIPGLRQQLAPKITPLGEDKQYQAPVLNALNALLNPGNISVYQTTDVIDELDRVYAETGDAKIWPERNAPYKTTINKESYTLTPDERTQYQRTRGQLTGQMMDAVMGADWYGGMDGTQKADVLNWIGNYANYVAKVEFSEGRGMDYANDTYDKYYRAMLSGTPLEDVVAEAKGKIVEPARQTVAAEATIAAAKIPEASKQEAETMSAEAKRLYAGFLKGGVSDSTARDLATKLEGSTATGHEQWREVYNAAGKEGEKAVTSVMDDEMKRNWQFAKNVGVSMDDYIKVREGFQDLNGNGRKSQDEWNATLDSFTFDKDPAKDKTIKGTLWQILTGSSSTKNNPYDKAAGQTVIDAKEKGGSSGAGKTYSMRGLRLPTPERREPISSGLKLQSTPAAKPAAGGLKLR